MAIERVFLELVTGAALAIWFWPLPRIAKGKMRRTVRGREASESVARLEAQPATRIELHCAHPAPDESRSRAIGRIAIQPFVLGVALMAGHN